MLYWTIFLCGSIDVKIILIVPILKKLVYRPIQACGTVPVLSSYVPGTGEDCCYQTTAISRGWFFLNKIFLLLIKLFIKKFDYYFLKKLFDLTAPYQ